ncbi:MAG: MBL fold metallo-hydrolase [Phenylobacterium sp.]|uniref:MBL fold metallo-hydrolase n=1 Tax=Phenylobacterium sp. TaxID=1871053 RepID=UPI002733DEE0|nr:MBL fold metallo-hydrolase [Phenylobacterium sp.]MDP3747400.1 MBL fold metallo-hydrolase [Phenylobacterium sp.]
MLKTFLLAASVFALAAGPISAQTRAAAPPHASAAARGVAKFQIGRFQLFALSDGTLPLDVDPLLKGAPKAEIDALLDREFQGRTVETSINAYLVDTGDRQILVDAGAGDLFGAFGGKLMQSLAAAGYSAGDVDDILVTHIHTDHSGGLTRGGRIAYPNATVHAGAADEAFFLDGARDHGHAAEARHIEEAMKTVEPYRRVGRLATFRGATQLFPGVSARPAPGHTPGHAVYRIESEGQSLEFWGDLIHVGAVQMPRPEITIAFDVDQDAARAERARLFSAAGRDRTLVAAAHLNFPGVGRVRPEGQGYVWVPAPHRYHD